MVKRQKNWLHAVDQLKYRNVQRREFLGREKKHIKSPPIFPSYPPPLDQFLRKYYVKTNFSTPNPDNFFDKYEL